MNDQADYVRQAVKDWLKRPVKPTSVVDVPELSAVIGTTVGEVRAENQDRAVIVRVNFGAYRFTLAVVCDGMGGMKNGAACAEIAVAAVVESCAFSRIPDPREKLRRAIALANAAVFDAFRGAGGTTLAAVISTGDTVAVATVGDTRVYRSNTARDRILQLSLDDTIAAELKRIRGTEASAELLDVSSNRLAQFVGIGSEMETRTYSVNTGTTDSLILASDGAYALPTTAFELILQNAPNPSQASWRVLQMSRWCGGQDNATILYVPLSGTAVTSTEPPRALPHMEVWDSFGKLDVPLPRASAFDYGIRQVAVDQPAVPPEGMSGKGRQQKKKPRSSDTKHKATTTKAAASHKTGAPLEGGQRELKIEISEDVTRDVSQPSGGASVSSPEPTDRSPASLPPAAISEPLSASETSPPAHDSESVGAELTGSANIVTSVPAPLTDALTLGTVQEAEAQHSSADQQASGKHQSAPKSPPEGIEPEPAKGEKQS